MGFNERPARWAFYLGLLGLAGVLFSPGAGGLATAAVCIALLVPHLYNHYEAGKTAPGAD